MRITCNFMKFNGHSAVNCIAKNPKRFAYTINWIDYPMGSYELVTLRTTTSAKIVAAPRSVRPQRRMSRRHLNQIQQQRSISHLINCLTVWPMAYRVVPDAAPAYVFAPKTHKIVCAVCGVASGNGSRAVYFMARNQSNGNLLKKHSAMDTSSKFRRRFARMQFLTSLTGRPAGCQTRRVHALSRIMHVRSINNNCLLINTIYVRLQIMGFMAATIVVMPPPPPPTPF